MSRPRRSPEERASTNFRGEVKRQLANLEISQKAVAEGIGISPARASQLLSAPDKITVERLRGFIQALEINPEPVLLLVGYTRKDIQNFKKEATK